MYIYIYIYTIYYNTFHGWGQNILSPPPHTFEYRIGGSDTPDSLFRRPYMGIPV